MKELSPQEASQVGGGFGLVLVGMAGAAFAFGYTVGKDLAERENNA